MAADRGSERSPSFRFNAGAVALAFAFFALADAALFGTPPYQSLLEPVSAAGSFDDTLDRTSARATDPRSDVLVLGDSRVYDGLDERTADAAAPGLHYLNAAVPGTTPRCWLEFDRALDPHADRFRAVVVPLDTYADDDSAIGSVDGNDRPFDLRYIVFHTPLSDAYAIAASFSEPQERLESFADLVLRGPLLREDLQEFAVDPLRRLRVVAQARAAPPVTAHPMTGSMNGLRVDFAHGTLQAPPGYGGSIDELRRQVLLVPAYSASYARYRDDWLGPILARYRATGTPVVFVRIPTRPLHRTLPPPPSGTIAAFAASGVLLVPQARYVALERPGLFADADHLNVAGAERFSALFGRDVGAALRGARGAASQGARDAARVASVAAVPAPLATSGAPMPLATTDMASAAPDAALSLRARFHALLVALEIGVPIAFQSYSFALFFAIVTAAFYALPSRPARRLLLLIASWYFYARWNAWYLLVLLALTATDFGFGLAVEAASGARRRVLLAAGIGANLAFLGTAKYADFITASIAGALRLPSDPWALHLLVPVGISFHTFQSISYLVDVSRGKFRAVRNPLDYALYLAFFPQLLAGPIVRAATFFGELWNWRAPSSAAVERGLGEIVLGLAKKGVLADRFAPVADAYFASPSAHPGALAAWSGTLAFGLQIYFDFSGYSNIAIGAARVLGFDFPQNFNRPYLAWSVTEFWRRWHMTLSAWLRDYLYIPLGGNRHGRLQTYRNLMLTMLLGGLWHGAGWTFIAWGGYHGFLLAAERALGIGRDRAAPPPRGAARVVSTLVTFGLVLAGWVLFRSQTFPEALEVARTLFAGGPGPGLFDWPLTLLALSAAAVEIVLEVAGMERLRAAPPALRGALGACLLLALELAVYRGAPAQFVYFKF